LWNVLGSVAIFSATMIGGIYSESLERFDAQTSVRILFLSMTAAMAVIAALGIWKPNPVYRHLHREEGPRSSILSDIARLGRHWPIYPALGAWLLWNFSPGGSTVLQYYMADKLGATDAQWGEYNAIFYLSFLPTFVLFGFLSRRYSLSTLLWVGTIIAIPQMVPVLFVHSPSALMLVAVPMGLMGGIANAAYMDLLIRSCPKGLEGTMMMMAWSMYAVAVNFGNVLGTSLYEWGGLFLCIAATTVVYAFILPCVWLVPRELVASTDGESL
jgi:predicted MFS family arabinose efflux permease